MLGNLSFHFEKEVKSRKSVKLHKLRKRRGPEIFVEGNTLKLDSSHVDLSSHLKLVQLFELFITNPQKTINKFAIMEAIYKISKVQYFSMSSRLKNSTTHNVVKLISRARKICRENLPNYGEAKYFYFDKEARGWSFAVHQFTQPTFFSKGSSGKLFSIGSNT